MRRVLKRIALGLVLLVALAVAGVLVFIHTDYGREVIRGRVEAQLQKSFRGRATIGKLEGSVLGEVVLRDVAIDDAEGRPAVRIKAVRLRLALLPLLHHRAHLDRLVVEDADVHLERTGDGKLALSQLVVKHPRSAWDVELPDIAIVRGRIAGEGQVIDGIEIRGGVSYPHDAPLRVDAGAYATWRGEPVIATVALRQDPGGELRVPAALVAAGGMVAIATGVIVRGVDSTGELVARVPRKALARFGITLPGEVEVAALVAPGPLVTATGTVDGTPALLVAQADVAARRIHGLIATGALEVPRGRAGGVATFDVAQGEPDALPRGTLFASAWTELVDAPCATIGLAVSSDGGVARVALDGLAERTRVTAGGAVRRSGRAIALAGAHLLATSSEVPSVYGAVRADLAASGVVWPHPDLAVAGTVDGTALRARGLAAATLHLGIDARHLPAAPVGSARLAVTKLAKGRTPLGDLLVTAASRADGQLATTVDAHRADAWVKVDALVAIAPTIAIALGHHDVRLGGNATWTGQGGQIAISRAQIAVTKLTTTSAWGTATVDGTYARRTRALAATLTATSPMVEHVTATVAATLPARSGERGAWRSAIQSATLRATGIQLDAPLQARLGIATQLAATADLSVDIADGARRGALTAYVHRLHGAPLARPVDIRIEASSDEHETKGTVALRGPGQVNLGDLSLAIPRDAEHIDRTAPVAGALRLTSTPAAMVAIVLGRGEVTSGSFDGAITLAGTLAAPTLVADLTATHLGVPVARGTAAIDRIALHGTWRDGAFDVALDGTEHAGNTLRLTARGRPDQRGEIALRLVAKQFELAPLLALAPGRAGGGAGRIDADLTMTGVDPRIARFAGELHVVGGRAPLSPSIGTLRAAKLDATIAHDQLTLALDGKLGAGALVARGTIDLATNAPRGGKLTATLRKVSPIGVYQPVIDADLTASVHRDAHRWVADIIVDNGDVVIPKRRGEKLFQPGAPEEMVLVDGKHPMVFAKDKRQPSDPVAVANITIHPTHVVDDDIRGVIEGQLTMSSTRDEFGIVGTISAERGDIDLFGRRYIVDRASAHYDGSTDPLLDIVLTHDYPDVTTVTTIRGRMSKPQVAMTANPGVYTQGQLLGFLLGGEPTGDPRDVTARDRATAAGESIIANELGTYIRGNLPIGVDVLRYESATTSNSAAVTAGRWLGHQLFIAYRRHLATRPDENAGEGAVEYWLGRRLSVEGTVGDRGYDGVDLLWRKRY